MKVEYFLKAIFTNFLVFTGDIRILNIGYSDKELFYPNGTLNININTVSLLANMSHLVYGKYPFIRTNTGDISIDNDTVKAYLFGDKENTSYILSIKGTTTLYGLRNYYKSSSVVYNDKYNDDLFLSCCFYKQTKLFDSDLHTCKRSNYGLADRKQIGFTSKQICSKSCYKESRNFEKNYYNIIDKILKNVNSFINIRMSNLVLTGHSLGGVLSTMMSIKWKIPAVTFESPGEKHYIDLLGVKYTLEDFRRIYHFGHNADIIFTGKCNGRFSWCYLGGYILETRCHIGYVCEYDSIKKLGIDESIFTHKIKYVRQNIIPFWNGTLPVCKLTPSCKECENWTYT
jgi:lipase ATG15